MSSVKETIGSALTTMLVAAVTAYAASLIFPEAKQKVKEKISRLLLIEEAEGETASSTGTAPINISGRQNNSSIRLVNLEKFRFTQEEINLMESTTITAVRNEAWKLLQDILALTESESPSNSPTYSASPSYSSFEARKFKLNASKLTASSSSSSNTSTLSASGEGTVRRLYISEEDLLALSTSERIELARYLASTINFANEKLNDIREHHELCRICEEEPKTVAFDPCGHFGCCEQCAKSCPTCPWCREGELTDNGVRKMSLHVV
eukprot:TRINITY_DN16362_c0_g1_i1.p1 TRINITY_DN16362_c0_g1~~TRINITY_DN16362_c0_g1_i1.p1  ORF type:complete len:266 (-),score=58.79 TRINITY_DN16362_c0_g1_i1:93-890(-)